MRRLSFLLALITASLTAITASISAAENQNAWPGEEKQIAIDACRMAFVKDAYQGYLSRQGLSAEEIAEMPFESTPADQQALVLEQLEPVLQVCDCAFDIIAAELPWADFQKDQLGDQQLLLSKQREIAESGRCPQASGPPATLFETYRTAAEAGDVEAQYGLGVLYAEGKGVEQNISLAKEWLSRAAKQGNRGAQAYLDSLKN